MPDASQTPGWLSFVWQQYPVAAVVAVAAWYTFRHVQRQHDDHLNRTERQTENRLLAKEAEIRRLSRVHAAERRRTREAKDELVQSMLHRITDLKEQIAHLTGRTPPTEG